MTGLSVSQPGDKYMFTSESASDGNIYLSPGVPMNNNSVPMNNNSVPLNINICIIDAQINH